MFPGAAPTRSQLTLFQITFSIESGPRCDDVIYMLCSWGIGERYGSTISIASCTLFTEQLQDEEDEKQ